MRIDLIYFSFQKQNIKWTAGEVFYAGKCISNLDNLGRFIKVNITSDYICCININLFLLPDENICFQLINKNHADIIHSGLKIFKQHAMSFHRFVNPVWIYNLNAPEDIESTNFKLSVDCFIVRTDFAKNFHWDNAVFEQYTSLGLYWGYAMYQTGCIIRYEPTLSYPLSQIKKITKISLSDELSLITLTYSRKWLYWAAYRAYMNKVGLSNLAKAFLVANKRIKISQDYILRKYDFQSDSEEKPKVSVFTPTLFRYTYLAEELRQLNCQTIRPHEVLITDQTDAEKRETKWLNDYNDLNIIYQPQDEKGQCNAWNFCLENAKGDYLLFLGDDADEIKPDFIERLYHTMQTFNADVVACNIKERENEYPFKQQDVFTSDIFPICLVKRSVFQKIGGYDYAYNKGIRADGDVAIRMHLNGALLVLDPSVKIHHHRAQAGGLRNFKERAVTRSMSRKSVFIFQMPSFTEFYLAKRYFSEEEYKEMMAVKMWSIWSIDGSWLRKSIKLFVYLFKKIKIKDELNKTELKAKQLFEYYPDIPKIKPN